MWKVESLRTHAYPTNKSSEGAFETLVYKLALFYHLANIFLSLWHRSVSFICKAVRNIYNIVSVYIKNVDTTASYIMDASNHWPMPSRPKQCCCFCRPRRLFYFFLDTKEMLFFIFMTSTASKNVMPQSYDCLGEESTNRYDSCRKILYHIGTIQKQTEQKLMSHVLPDPFFLKSG